MAVEAKPTINPSVSVFLNALRKRSRFKTRLNTSSVMVPSA